MAKRPGLWANIRKKRKRIKRSGGRMRTPREARKTGLTDATFRKVAKRSKRR